jgi:signal transduction histidine kinase
MKKYSTVNIRGEKETKTVEITSDSKPEIEPSVIKKWQALIDTIAKIVHVPSGLIMRLNEENIEVFLKSETDENPYEVNEKVPLIHGLYCETVIGTQIELLVPDATKSPIWKIDNPDIDINMISYLGLPINWPDGEVFGTVCLLDNKENHYSQNFKDLLGQVKILIETDLQLLLKSKTLEDQNAQLGQLVKLKTMFLSLISHDVRGSIGSVIMLLDQLISEFDNYKKSELLPLLSKVNNNVSTSYSTLEDVLFWTKHDLVHLNPDIASLNIVEIIESILSGYHDTIDLKNISITKEYYSKDACISADEKMIKVVIRNILSNAIKYTNKKGSIYIRVLHADKHHIIEVEDTGIGMRQSTVDSLFSYNDNHNAQGTAGESSAGIGLILVKEFIDKNNASISVTSELGKGSIFRITI